MNVEYIKEKTPFREQCLFRFIWQGMLHCMAANKQAATRYIRTVLHSSHRFQTTMIFHKFWESPCTIGQEIARSSIQYGSSLSGTGKDLSGWGQKFDYV